MYHIKNLYKQYGNQKVLNGTSIQIGASEMISVMGKSGSGKSTLLGIMAGLIAPDSGSIHFNDLDITTLNEESLAEFRMKHVGIVFQDFRLIPSLSVGNNILMAIYPRTDISKTEKTRRMRDLAASVGLEHKLDQIADLLSGGEKQRVAIARSLINQPDFVLADEPTGNLDDSTSEDIMTLFSELHADLKTTFIIVTHDKDIASKTQQIYRMEKGVLQ